MGDIPRMEGTSAPLMLVVAEWVQECAVNFFGDEPKLCPFWAFTWPNRSAGEMRETGEAWPLWRGFFCFYEPPPTVPATDQHSIIAPCLAKGRSPRHPTNEGHLVFLFLVIALSRCRVGQAVCDELFSLWGSKVRPDLIRLGLASASDVIRDLGMDRSCRCKDCRKGSDAGRYGFECHLDFLPSASSPGSLATFTAMRRACPITS
jgi:hypothetical protein